MAFEQFMDYTLCNLAMVNLQRQDGQNSASYDADDDAQMLHFMRQASAEVVENYLFRLPLPYSATHTYNANSERDALRGLWTELKPHVIGDFNDVLLVDDLLAVTSITNGDGVAVTSSEYKLMLANQKPHYAIRILATSSQVWTYDDDPQDAISVVGTWGYVPHYATCWNDSDKDIPSGGITATATTWTFSTAGDAGSFSIGDYVRVNSEIMQVVGANSTTGVMTVVRGQLGTTASTHDAGDAIELFTFHSGIARVVAEYAGYLYKSKDRIGNTTEVYPGGVVVTEGMRPQLVEQLRKHSRKRF